MRACRRYGKWGYGFGRAAFCLTREQYDAAVEVVRNVRLDDLVHDFTVRQAGRQAGVRAGSAHPLRGPEASG